MDLYSDYCDKVYRFKTTFYVTRLKKIFQEKGYDKEINRRNVPLPIKQYSIYKGYLTELKRVQEKYEIDDEKIKNYQYDYNPHNSSLHLYSKILYDDPDYQKSRRYIMSKNIEKNNLTPLILSFLEFDKMNRIVQDIRSGEIK